MPMRRGSTGIGFLRPTVEQAFGGELFLELLKGDLKGANADRFEKFADHLQLAPAFVNAEAPAGDYPQAVLRLEAQQARLHAKNHNTKLGLAIVEREVEMAGAGRTQVGDLALDPDVRVLALQARAQAPR